MGNNGTTGFEVAFPLFLPSGPLTHVEYQPLHVCLIKLTSGILQQQIWKGKSWIAEPATNILQSKMLPPPVFFHGNSSTGSHQGLEQEEEEGLAMPCMANKMLKRIRNKSH